MRANHESRFVRETDADRSAVLKAIVTPRLMISWLAPNVDAGAESVKAAVAQPLLVEVNICCDGHEQLSAQLMFQPAGSEEGICVPLTQQDEAKWSAVIYPTQTGVHRLMVEAWVDDWSTYCKALQKKRAAHLDIRLDVQEGLLLLEQLAGAAAPPRRKQALELHQMGSELAHATVADACERLLGDQIARQVQSLKHRSFLARVSQTFEVEREAAGFASWYELFPRSASGDASIGHGTFDDVIARLPAIQAMGFDVLYFPPIHPIGHTHRKGRNNALKALPGEPGSPYAIGSHEGGHTAVHPQLGGLESFQRLRRAAQKLGIELALDFAIQCSPDHPWLRQHPGWFRWRPDGTVHYAENPPKKYEDIVPVDFYARDAKPDLWLALRDVVLFWVEQGVKTFRVDNPHTKPLPFWQWLIGSVRRRHPEVIFLSEAFTYPAMMYQLAKLGFSQSYTYFIWRNTRHELVEYLTELTGSAPRDFFRPHFFVNTPDINPHFLQTSGRAGFVIRAALAATLSGLWGIYSGFELCEADAIPGREEYWRSEKYEIKHRNWKAPGNIIDIIAQLNRIRRANPALHTHMGVRFHDGGNERILYFSKAARAVNNYLLIAISLDPHQGQEAVLPFPAACLGLPADAEYEVEELMRGQHFRWRNEPHHWYFNPDELPLAIWRVRTVGAEKVASGAH